MKAHSKYSLQPFGSKHPAALWRFCCTLWTRLAHKQTNTSPRSEPNMASSPCVLLMRANVLSSWWGEIQAEFRSSGKASGKRHAGRLYQVRIGAGHPAATVRVGILPCFQSSRPLRDQLWWNWFSPRQQWLRNPYFQLNGEICTPVRCSDFTRCVWLRDKRFAVFIVHSLPF